MFEKLNTVNRIHHNGHEYGYMSSISYYPTEDLKVVVLSNRHGFLDLLPGNTADELDKEISEFIMSFSN